MTRMIGADAAGWAQSFDEALERIGGRFGRAEPRRRAEAYLRGLLAPVERKNGWQLAEAAGDATPDGVQEFLSRVRWDADAVRDDLQSYVADHLGDPNAVLVLDDPPPTSSSGQESNVVQRDQRLGDSRGRPAVRRSGIRFPTAREDAQAERGPRYRRTLVQPAGMHP